MKLDVFCETQKPARDAGSVLPAEREPDGARRMQDALCRKELEAFRAQKP
jgi:hypothetical protein